MTNEKEIELCRKYQEDNKSTVELAEEYGLSPPTISKILKRHDVNIRTRSERQKLALQTGRHPSLPREWNKERRKKQSEKMRQVYHSLPEEKKELHRNKAKEAYEKRSEEDRKRLVRLGSESSIRATRIGSKAERYLAGALRKLGYNVKIHEGRVFYGEKLQIDILIPGMKVCIEVDGPTHYSEIFGKERLDNQRAADNRKNGLVMDHGFVMIRVRNDLQNFTEYFGDRMVKKVVEVLKQIKEKFPDRDNRFFHIDEC